MSTASIVWGFFEGSKILQWFEYGFVDSLRILRGFEDSLTIRVRLQGFKGLRIFQWFKNSFKSSSRVHRKMWKLYVALHNMTFGFGDLRKRLDVTLALIREIQTIGFHYVDSTQFIPSHSFITSHLFSFIKSLHNKSIFILFYVRLGKKCWSIKHQCCGIPRGIGIRKRGEGSVSDQRPLAIQNLCLWWEESGQETLTSSSLLRFRRSICKILTILVLLSSFWSESRRYYRLPLTWIQEIVPHPWAKILRPASTPLNPSQTPFEGSPFKLKVSALRILAWGVGDNKVG
jgi:hypothetical protein